MSATTVPVISGGNKRISGLMKRERTISTGEALRVAATIPAIPNWEPTAMVGFTKVKSVPIIPGTRAHGANTLGLDEGGDTRYEDGG